MPLAHLAALLFATVSALAIAFQLALAAGVPLGAYTLGGAFKERFTPPLRIAALVQATIIAGMAVVVLVRAGLVLAKWSQVAQWLVWVVVAIVALSLVLNLLTPSARERAVWAPAALLLLTSSVFVAIQGSA